MASRPQKKKLALYVTVIDGQDGGNFSSRLVIEGDVPGFVWDFLLYSEIECIYPPDEWDNEKERHVDVRWARGSADRRAVVEWFDERMWYSEGNHRRMWHKDVSGMSLVPESEVWEAESFMEAPPAGVKLLGCRNYMLEY